MKEVWKDIPGFKGLYKVSSVGRVKSFRGHHINPCLSSNGYPTVMFYNKGRKMFKVHSLVVLAFLDNEYRRKGLVVNHKNGIKTDNRLCNLEVVTHSQNIIHSFTKGNREIIMGEKHYAAKISSHDVKQIKKMYNTGWYMQVTLSEMFGISKTNIHGILNNKIWKNKKHKIK